MRCPKSRFPIRIIVFDELELIIFVSQGLTLSTASLVLVFIISRTHVSVTVFAKIYLLLTNTRVNEIPKLTLEAVINNNQ